MLYGADLVKARGDLRRGGRGTATTAAPSEIPQIVPMFNVPRGPAPEDIRLAGVAPRRYQPMST